MGGQRRASLWPRTLLPNSGLCPTLQTTRRCRLIQIAAPLPVWIQLIERRGSRRRGDCSSASPCTYCGNVSVLIAFVRRSGPLGDGVLHGSRTSSASMAASSLTSARVSANGRPCAGREWRVDVHRGDLPPASLTQLVDRRRERPMFGHAALCRTRRAVNSAPAHCGKRHEGVARPCLARTEIHQPKPRGHRALMVMVVVERHIGQKRASLRSGRDPLALEAVDGGAPFPFACHMLHDARRSSACRHEGGGRRP